MGALIAALLLAALSGMMPAWAAVATTKHNLSTSGPGTVKVHGGERNLRVLSCAAQRLAGRCAVESPRPGSTYTPYTSSTARGNAGQPNGASLLCLSCHDGTIALGELLNACHDGGDDINEHAGGCHTAGQRPVRRSPDFLRLHRHARRHLAAN